MCNYAVLRECPCAKALALHPPVAEQDFSFAEMLAQLPWGLLGCASSCGFPGEGPGGQGPWLRGECGSRDGVSLQHC